MRSPEYAPLFPLDGRISTVSSTCFENSMRTDWPLVQHREEERERVPHHDGATARFQPQMRSS